jgi:hypothetical protein
MPPILRRLGLLSASAAFGLPLAASAGPITTTSTSTTSSTLASTTTTRTTTTSLGTPICAGDVEVDPEDRVASLAPGVLATVPIRVTVSSGLLDLSTSDGGAGGTFSGSGGCFGFPVPVSSGQTRTFDCGYTPPMAAPAQITLRATLSPHSGGGTACGSGSTGDLDSKVFPVAATTTSSTTTTLQTSTTSSSTTTSSTTLSGRVAVCHKERKTILVNASALEAHLGHGDAPGPCVALDR